MRASPGAFQRLLALTCTLLVCALTLELDGSSTCSQPSPTGFRLKLNASDRGGAPCKWHVQCAPLSSKAYQEARGEGRSPAAMSKPSAGSCVDAQGRLAPETGLAPTGFDASTGRCRCEVANQGCGYCGAPRLPVNPAAQAEDLTLDADCRERGETFTSWVDNQDNRAYQGKPNPIPTYKDLDVCDIAIGGGGPCTIDSQCGAGLCLRDSNSNAGVCGCYPGYTCPFCEIKHQDIAFGARCPTPRAANSTSAAVRSGGALCASSADCSGQQCESPNDGTPKLCKCGANQACGDCSLSFLEDIVQGGQSCGCDGVHCPSPNATNGYCSGNGKCVCHFPFVGPDCGTNPCFPDGAGRRGLCEGPLGTDPTSLHTQCVIDRDTSLASCVCQDGWTVAPGQDVLTHGCTSPPSCGSDAECGVWSDIAGLPNPHREVDIAGSPAARGQPFYGGSCVAGKCVCKSRYGGPERGCPKCDAIVNDQHGRCFGGNSTHAEVKNVTGGGPCVDDLDCSTKGTPALRGGTCFRPAAEGPITAATPGRCVCFDGFTCDHCSEIGQDPTALPNGCPARTAISESLDIRFSPAPTRAPTPVPTPAPVPLCGTCDTGDNVACTAENEAEKCGAFGTCVDCTIGGDFNSSGLQSIFDNNAAGGAPAPALGAAAALATVAVLRTLARV